MKTWSLVVVFALFSCHLISGKPRPLVLWHGMGDTCCFPFSMGAIKSAVENAIPGIYVYSVEIGSSIVEDELHGFIGSVNDQIEYAHKKFKSDPNLANGFNAVGFSQGGQFLRAYVERFNDPPVHNLVTMGGQHRGVADIPDCVSVNETICRLVEDALALGAYNPLAQALSVQAQYFHDPLEQGTYLKSNVFMPDINNLNSVNAQYKKNFMSLNTLLLVMFEYDTVVVPRESEWFGFYKSGSVSDIETMQDSRLYQDDLIGLKTLDQLGRLKFDKAPGNHMQFTLEWFHKHVTTKYLNNTL